MSFFPVNDPYCPEPDTKENLTYNFISSEYKSCYGGYFLTAMVSYSCMDNPKLEPQKTLQCGFEGIWIETDTTPWPTCKTPEPNNINTTPLDNNDNSGKMSFIILHLIRDYNGQVF
jgi:hypothetical protein